jgi:type IV secretory pathway VirJ component
MMKLNRVFAALMGAALGLAAHPAGADETAAYDTGMIPSPHVGVPADGLKAMVFLLSGAGGWSSRDEARMQALVSDGAAVVGIDYKAYIASLAKNRRDDCIYMISDIESLSQQIQRRAGDSAYHAPILAGEGEGGALVLAMMAQSPPATIGQAIAVDPTAEIPLTKQLCTPATKQPTPNGYIYGLTDDVLPAPITVLTTPAAPADGKANIEAIVSSHPDVAVSEGDNSDGGLLLKTIEDHVNAGAGPTNDLGLPLTELEATPKTDTMAIFISGDGGWRDIDSEIGDYLQSQGVPTIGLDSLRYFWKKKDQAQTSADLAKIIETYKEKWKVKNVLLVGYSFGADVLAPAYNALPARDKAAIRQITLLAPTHSIDYEISVTGWFGAPGSFEGGKTLDALAKIDPKLIQCIYGTDDDDDDVCPELKGKGYDVIAVDGDHHFNDAYDKVGELILDGLSKRSM